MKDKSRLIYAGEALDRLRRLAREPYYQHEGEDWSVGVSMACGEVHECTTVDAAPVVHGRWHIDKSFVPFFCICLECGASYDVDGAFEWNYCPNCGAKMDGGNEDG